MKLLNYTPQGELTRCKHQPHSSDTGTEKPGTAPLALSDVMQQYVDSSSRPEEEEGKKDKVITDDDVTS
jgi:hypothetical protein